MYVPLELPVREWLKGFRLFRCRPLGLPNYPIETLAIVTPANDNRETHDPIRALILAQATRRQLGLPDGIIRRHS